jgi:hypothetical protein
MPAETRLGKVRLSPGGSLSPTGPLASGSLLFPPTFPPAQPLFIPHHHAAILDNRNAGLFHFLNHLALSFRP